MLEKLVVREDNTRSCATQFGDVEEGDKLMKK